MHGRLSMLREKSIKPHPHRVKAAVGPSVNWLILDTDGGWSLRRQDLLALNAQCKRDDSIHRQVRRPKIMVG